MDKNMLIRDDTHMTSMKIVQFLRPPPPPLSICVQNSTTPLSLDVQFKLNPPSPRQVLTNQWKENTIQEWVLYVPSFRLLFVFSINSLISSGFPFFCLAFLLNSFHRACERTKSKQKQNQVTSYSNWPRVLLFDLAVKQCNDILKSLVTVRMITQWKEKI